MLSLRKLTANRINSLRSTGPRSEAGKDRVGGNALKHGFSSRSVVVIQEVERQEDYDALLSGVIKDFDPVGTVELRYAERVSQLFWRLERIVRFESEFLSQWQANIIPSNSQLDAGLARREEQRSLARALGSLLLPSHVQLPRELVLKILTATIDYLGIGREQLFAENISSPMISILAESESESCEDKSMVGTVGAVLSLLHEIESRLTGRQIDAESFGQSLIGGMYEHYFGLSKVWERWDSAAERSARQQRTEGLVLRLEQATALIQRYETSLRRDLSRTVMELIQIQAARGCRPLCTYEGETSA